MIRMRSFEAGEVIFFENDMGETAYVIEEGRVEVLKNMDGNNVHLAYIGAGEPFGEMSIIDEKPRSATIVAVEKTAVREIHREDFVQNLQTDPEMTIRLLKVLFERLREANAMILQFHRPQAELGPLKAAQPQSAGDQSAAVVCLEALTPQARRALQDGSLEITKFPFRIGRRSSDPMVENDLSIPDAAPMQISRHHVALVKQDGGIGVRDRGSRLGSLVDGKRVGGHGGDPGIVLFTGTESSLVLGQEDSPFRFRVSIKAASQLPDKHLSTARAY
jgi:CRP-like cAMP-binding protein